MPLTCSTKQDVEARRHVHGEQLQPRLVAACPKPNLDFAKHSTPVNEMKLEDLLAREAKVLGPGDRVPVRGAWCIMQGALEHLSIGVLPR